MCSGIGLPICRLRSSSDAASSSTAFFVSSTPNIQVITHTVTCGASFPPFQHFGKFLLLPHFINFSKMAPVTPEGAWGRAQSFGSRSAPHVVSDLDDLPTQDTSRRLRSLGSPPLASNVDARSAKAPPTPLTDRKRLAQPEAEEEERLKRKQHLQTRRKQREQYFDSLAKEADARGNLPSSRRRIITEDDLEKLELKKCFELLHAMSRASDPTAPIGSTRNSIGGFLKAIFMGWGTGMVIANIPDVGPVWSDAPAGRICGQCGSSISRT